LSTAVARRTPLDRVTQLGALAIPVGIFFLTTRIVPTFHGTYGVIAALGFLLLSGTLVAELLGLLGLPHLTAYILVGVLAGPHCFGWVDHEAVARLDVVGVLALALIALAGGAELKAELLRSVWRGLLYASLFQCCFVLVVWGVAVFRWARALRFTRGLELGALAGIALLWGVLSVSRSPSATLAIFAQTKADGPVSRFSLAFIMSSDVVVILLMALGIAAARPLVDPSVSFSLDDIGVLGHEILGSVSLGTTLGLLLGAYLRLIGGQLIIVLVAAGYGLTEGLHYLHFDPLLSFLIAGFVVTNFTRQGPRLLEAVERTSGVVFVVFFAAAGAHLDLPLLGALWPVALGLASVRVVATWVAHRIAARTARVEPAVQRWGWASLVSQAGLTLGLAVVIERAFPITAGGFRSLAVATVAVNELVGPIVFKLALERSGETGKAARAH
jgi:Kef-type K+ transport system membrane component KefB